MARGRWRYPSPAAATSEALQDLDLSLATVKDRHIEHVLHLFDGNMVIAALRLKVDRRTLQRYVKRKAARLRQKGHR